MLVAGDEQCMLGVGERDQVVVARVGRDTGDISRVVGRRGSRAEELEEAGPFLSGDPGREFWIPECPFELGEQRFGDDEVEAAVEPCSRTSAGVPLLERMAAMRTLGSRTARTDQRRRGRVVC